MSMEVDYVQNGFKTAPSAIAWAGRPYATVQVKEGGSDKENEGKAYWLQTSRL